MWQMQNLGWGWWLIMTIGMVAVWGLIIDGAVVLTRSSGRARQVAQWPASLEWLRRRCARGPISYEEHEEGHEVGGRPPRSAAS